MRSPLPKPTKALKLHRLPLKKIGKKGKLKAEAMKRAKTLFFICYGIDDGEYRIAHCQLCAEPIVQSACDNHHLVKRSQGGKDEPKDLICLCRLCHIKIHADRVLFERVRDSGVNMANGEILRDTIIEP